MKIMEFYKAYSPRKHFCVNNITSKQNFGTGSSTAARFWLGAPLPAGAICHSSMKSRWSTCPSSSPPCVLFFSAEVLRISLLTLNLRWYYSQTQKASSIAILCGRVRRDLVLSLSGKLKLGLASFRASCVANKHICPNGKLPPLFPKAALGEPSSWAIIAHRIFCSAQTNGWSSPGAWKRDSWDISKHLPKCGRF